MAWDKYLHEVPLKPGVLEFLNHCRENGIKLGIATSNSRELVENIAKVHRLHEYFSCIMTGCEVERGKPFPDIYLAVAKALEVLPERCLDRNRGVGNAAGEGAKLALSGETCWNQAKEIPKHVEFVELASEPDFPSRFIQNLNFEEGDHHVHRAVQL